MRPRPTFLLLLLLADAAAAGQLCLSTDGVFHYAKSCSERADFDRSVLPSPIERKLVFLNRDQHNIVIGTIPPNATRFELGFAGAFSTVETMEGPPDTDGTITIVEAKRGTWSITLDPWWFRRGRINVQVPQGLYDLTIQAGKETLVRMRGVDYRKAKPGPSIFAGKAPPPLVLKGSAVGSGGAPADFAHVLADCRDVVCDADADGRFNCTVRPPRSDEICVEHPRFGRARINLDHRKGVVDLQTVTLVEGATIRLFQPEYVLFPAGTTAVLRTHGRAIGPEKKLGESSVVEFNGLAAGRYEVLIAGPEPLQRRILPVTVARDGVNELTLSLDPFRLTGEVVYRDKPVGGATVSLTGEAWNAELKTNDSGVFSAEMWDAADYGVIVDSAQFNDQYGVMKRASAADSHWKIVVPSRKLFGSVTDKQTGQPVPSATLLIESDSENTRRSRSVPVIDGKFELAALGAGHYVVLAKASGYASGERVDFAIAESDGDKELNLTLDRGRDVNVTVLDSNANPISGALVIANLSPDETRVEGLARTAVDGSVSIPLKQGGPRTLYILPLAGSFTVATIPDRLPDTPLQVVVSEGPANLRVNARLQDGQPVSGLRLDVTWGGVHIPQGVIATFAAMHSSRTVTDGSGWAVLSRLPIGPYEIHWRSVAGQPIRPDTPVRLVLAAGDNEVSQTFAAKPARAAP